MVSHPREQQEAGQGPPHEAAMGSSAAASLKEIILSCFAAQILGMWLALLVTKWGRGWGPHQEILRQQVSVLQLTSVPTLPTWSVGSHKTAGAGSTPG